MDGDRNAMLKKSVRNSTAEHGSRIAARKSSRRPKSHLSPSPRFSGIQVVPSRFAELALTIWISRDVLVSCEIGQAEIESIWARAVSLAAAREINPESQSPPRGTTNLADFAGVWVVSC